MSNKTFNLSQKRVNWNDPDVKTDLRRCALGIYTQQDLAKKYHVTKRTIAGRMAKMRQEPEVEVDHNDIEMEEEAEVHSDMGNNQGNVKTDKVPDETRCVLYTTTKKKFSQISG